MAVNLGLLTLGNTAGLLGLLALIPFIIIYLIRPRPTRIEVPSLMFLMTSKEVPRQQSFLRNFARDWLFLIQLLIILFLIFHLTEPLTTYQHDITAENTVIVLDASGSMHAKERRGTRFELAKDAAKQALAGKNTLIIAKSAPKLLTQDAEYRDAVDALSYVKASYTPTALGEAMILAGEVLSGQEGRVVVISDFLSNEGIDPGTAKNVLEGKGLVVDFINPGREGPKDNVGIVDLEVGDEITTVYVRNFNDEAKTVTISVGDLEKEINLPPLTTDTYSFTTPTDLTQIDLRPLDDLDADNTAYLSVPTKSEITVQLISSNASIFLKNAFESKEGVIVEIAEPPIVPLGDYDVYVIHDINPLDILPGTFEDIRNKVNNGASLVIAAQDNLGEIDFGELLPVVILGSAKKGFIQVEQLNKFTKNVDFGGVDKYLLTEKKVNAVTIASIGNSSVITFMQQGKGKVIYYGILEDANDFKLAPSYPVFWVKMTEFLVDQENIAELNTKTGETRILEDVTKIVTPSQTIKQNAFIFDDAGYYKVGGQIIAANLLSEAESDITLRKIVGTSDGTVDLKPVTEERELSFEIPILLIILVLLGLELLYIKVRGDI